MFFWYTGFSLCRNIHTCCSHQLNQTCHRLYTVSRQNSSFQIFHLVRVHLHKENNNNNNNNNEDSPTLRTATIWGLEEYAKNKRERESNWSCQKQQRQNKGKQENNKFYLKKWSWGEKHLYRYFTREICEIVHETNKTWQGKENL